MIPHKEGEDRAISPILPSDPSSIENNTIHYIAPYEVRKGSRIAPAVLPPCQDLSEGFAVRLSASVNRAATSTVPFSSRRLEISLGWGGTQQSLRWIPGRQLVPSWDVQVVAGLDELTRQETRNGFVRGILISAVGRMPVVWRLASWM
jgi:hypothetical protein